MEIGIENTSASTSISYLSVLKTIVRVNYASIHNNDGAGLKIYFIYYRYWLEIQKHLNLMTLIFVPHNDGSSRGNTKKVHLYDKLIFMVVETV